LIEFEIVWLITILNKNSVFFDKKIGINLILLYNNEIKSKKKTFTSGKIRF
jgi:hypothetical protein